MGRKNTLPRPEQTPAVPVPAPQPRPVAVVDMGASAIRLVVAEGASEGPLHLLEEVSRGVLLGKDTFTHGRLGAATIEATLKALEGFRRIMDTYGVIRYRAVATSAVREASNADAFLDRVRLRTGLEVEVIDGSEENRLTYLAVRERLAQHPALEDGDALLVEIGGGSADISFLRKGQPVHSGTYPLGSIRMRQSLAGWQGSHEQGMRLLVRHIHNVVDDIRREMPLREAKHVISHVERIAFDVVTVQIARWPILEPLPRRAGIHARARAARVVNDRIDAFEVFAIGVDVGIDEIDLDDVVDITRFASVQQHEVIALAEHGQELAREVAGCAGDSLPRNRRCRVNSRGSNEGFVWRSHARGGGGARVDGRHSRRGTWRRGRQAVVAGIAELLRQPGGAG